MKLLPQKIMSRIKQQGLSHFSLLCETFFSIESLLKVQKTQMIPVNVKDLSFSKYNWRIVTNLCEG